MIRLPWRRWLAKSWWLSRAHYRLRGVPMTGLPDDHVWCFAYGANMHDSAFRERRGMHPLEWRAGRTKGYRLRFNLEGRPKGKAAPANIAPDPEAEVWGVFYRISRRNLLHPSLRRPLPVLPPGPLAAAARRAARNLHPHCEGNRWTYQTV